MIWNRRGGVIGVLALAQVGVIACYHVALSGSAAPAGPPDVVAWSKKNSTPVPPVAAPANPQPAGTAESNSPKPGPAPAPDVPAMPDIPATPTTKQPASAPAVEPAGSATGTEPKGTAAAPAAPEPKPSPVAPPAPAPAVPPSVPVAPSPPAVTPPSAGAGPGPASPLGPDPLPPAPAATVPALPGAKPPQLPEGDTLPQPPGPAAPGFNPALPAPPPAPVEQPVAAPRCPWVLRVEIVQGRTQLTAETSKDVHFRLSCETLNLQAPRGSIEAKGAVQLSSEGIDGTCDRLTISWQDDHVVLEGQAQMKCRRDGQDLELNSDRLSLRLTGARIEAGAQAEESEPPAAKRPVSSRVNRTKRSAEDE